MSENQSSKPASDSDNRTAQDSRIDDVDTPLANSAEQMTIESLQPDVTDSKSETISSQATVTQNGNTQNTDDQATNWETAPLPGTVGLAATSPLNTAREDELLTLIHDLNECNDVLLTRVSQLENTLGESQRKLQQANEQSQIEKRKMAEQALAEQTLAQQASQKAQQQVAKVVDQLETAEQSLQRQQLINETLQSELDNAQERVSQLEHESALNAQQHAEEAQARVQAETTIRDLRSRLQRQQRYTLQFKAALEKSLTVTARSAGTSVQGAASHHTLSTTTHPTSFSTPALSTPARSTPALSEPANNGVTMPKAQRIMPWAGAISTPFEGIDPHLESLIRGASIPKPAPQPSSISSDTHFEPSTIEPSTIEPPTSDQPISTSAAPSAESATEDSDAEANLWKDMERVIENSTGDFEPTTTTIEPTVDTAETSGAAEPKLNWQRKVVTPPDNVQDEPSKALEKSSMLNATPEITPSLEKDIEKDLEKKEPLIQALGQKAPNDRAVVIDPYTVPVGQAPAAEVAFTEPSPWGTPLMEKAIAKVTESAADLSDIVDATSEHLPALEGETSVVAPTVNPLRTQKKIGSMSAVQLPTFEKAKAGSFKR